MDKKYASRPATWGEAMEVPEIVFVEVLLLFQVERI